ncbi:hypothetical protein AAC387_Pa04g0938 [Persea americana]
MRPARARRRGRKFESPPISFGGPRDFLTPIFRSFLSYADRNGQNTQSKEGKYRRCLHARRLATLKPESCLSSRLPTSPAPSSLHFSILPLEAGSLSCDAVCIHSVPFSLSKHEKKTLAPLCRKDHTSSPLISTGNTLTPFPGSSCESNLCLLPLLACVVVEEPKSLVSSLFDLAKLIQKIEE